MSQFISEKLNISKEEVRKIQKVLCEITITLNGVLKIQNDATEF